MVWTLPTGIFFATIALILVGMTVWEFADPSDALAPDVENPDQPQRMTAAIQTAAMPRGHHRLASVAASHARWM